MGEKLFYTLDSIEQPSEDNHKTFVKVRVILLQTTKGKVFYSIMGNIINL